MKQIFTTGQAAKICRVAPRTVRKWFDSGRILGYRVPGTQDIRIPRENLLKFMKEHHLDTTELDQEESGTPDWIRRLQENPNFRVEIVSETDSEICIEVTGPKNRRNHEPSPHQQSQ